MTFCFLGMPRIPGCTAALSSLAISYLSNGSTTPDANRAFRRALPQPYWLTKERFESKINLIKAAMGQGGQAKLDTTNQADEAILAAKMGKAKL